MKKDPKPNLSTAAIQSNIEYYTALRDRARREYNTMEVELDFWKAKLENAKTTKLHESKRS